MPPVVPDVLAGLLLLATGRGRIDPAIAVATAAGTEDVAVTGLLHHGPRDVRDHSASVLGRPWYCASVTCSIQSTGDPFSFSWTAMWLIAVAGPAPCQCFSPGGNHTTSPGRISSIGPPSRCIRPNPAVTMSVCPSGWVCQAVRAPGSKVTSAIATRPGSGGAFKGSMRTVPVKYSAGPFPDGCDPARMMSMLLPPV